MEAAKVVQDIDIQWIRLCFQMMKQREYYEIFQGYLPYGE